MNFGSIMKKQQEDPFKPKDICSICDSKYDEDAGGVQGHFGILPVTFCEWCYSSIYDMIAQDIKANDE